jgi:hypothetical protein
MKYKKRWIHALCAAALAISLISLNYFRAPYVWIAAVWSTVAFSGVIYSRNSITKAVWLNVGVAITTLGMIESYFWLSGGAGDKLRYEYQERRITRHTPLGYAPQESTVYSGARYSGDKAIYHVTYSIGANGLRIGAPPVGGSDSADCVVFFGDSFTFGEGVSDNETMPYLVGQQSGGQYHTYNFGFHGYGPHQMLVTLEYALEGHVLDCKPRFAVYQAIPDHLRRITRDTYGPRYVLENDGHVRLAGRLDDARNNIITTVVMEQLQKSLLVQIINKRISSSDVALFLGIVDSSRNIFEHRYTGSMFHVIFWDTEDHCPRDICQAILEGFRDKRIRVHLISNILPEYNKNKAKYTIGLGDKHPNALAHGLIAKYVIENILSEQ